MNQDSALTLSIITETPIPYVKDNNIHVALGKYTFPAKLFIFLLHRNMYNCSISIETKKQVKKCFDSRMDHPYETIYGEVGKWWYDLNYSRRNQPDWREKVISVLSNFSDEYANQLEEIDNQSKFDIL